MSDIFNFSGLSLIMLFTRVFLIAFGILYLLYTIVLVRQTQVLNRTVESQSSPLIALGSQIQLFLSIILILLAVFLL